MRLRCELQDYFRYTEELKLPPPVAAAKGTGVHEGGRHNHLQKRTSRVDLPVAEIVDASVVGFDEAVKDGVLEEPGQNSAVAIGAARDRVAVLATLYAEKLAPNIQPARVEASIEAHLPGVPFGMRAVLDLVQEDRRIIDLKTTGARGRLNSEGKAAKEAAESFQLGMQALLADRLDQFEGITPPAAREVGFAVAVDTKVPKAFTVWSARTEEDYRVIQWTAARVVEGIQAGNAAPTGLGTWACSPRYCGYWRICPAITPTMRRMQEKESEEG